MIMTSENAEIFNKVLTLGPSLKTHGGMASVLCAYRTMVPGFRHIATNSRYGSVAGAFNAVGAAVRMVLERLRGRSILHVHSAAGKSFVRKTLFMRWGRLLGYKVIFHCHSGASIDYYRRRGIPEIKAILGRADAIVGLSDTWKRYFADTFGFSNVYVVTNPVEIPATAPQPAAGAPLTLLFMGMIRDDKGVFDLVDTVAENAARWRGRLKVRIGGSGEVQRLECAIADAGIADIVEFIGWVSGAEKEQAYADAHIVVLPSYFEALPMCILEGMARRKAIIATAVGGIPDLVADGTNGRLLAPGDKDALGEAIDSYLDDRSLLDTHAAASLARAAAFSPEALRSNLLALYRSLS